MIKKNIGIRDRLIRFTIAFLLLGYALWQGSWIAGAASAFVFYEAIASWCVFYQLIGKSSCPIPSADGSEQSQDRFTKLLICLLLCFGVELTAGWFTHHSVATWYPTLAKPWWTPPDVAFPIVWTAIYALMAISLWIISIRPGVDKTPAYIAFGIQLLLNFAWSWLFFYMHDPLLALVDIALLVVAICATISYFWKISPLAGMLLFPYVIWVAFASTINLYIFLLN